ncbi:pyroglutamyl-peptidase 1 [Ceratobasidium sp. AG-Ba]|nr:pyroglutamyl-peptidase 1 [Ceratobasidium sp. AG-Ba]
MPAVESAPSKPEKRTLRVLLTGFGPFRNVDKNPSWLAVSTLNNQTFTFTPPPGAPGPPNTPKPKKPTPVEAHISALEIPVTYDAVLKTIPELHASKQYDVMLHVGVGSPGGLEVERQAHKTGYNEQDADGKMCPRIDDQKHSKRGFGKGFEKFGEVLKTGVNVDDVVDHLKSLGLEQTKPSNDPGHYLCDFIYYCSLACAQNDGKRVKVLFMHVPPAGVPYEVEDMTRAVKGIVEYYANHA